MENTQNNHNLLVIAPEYFSFVKDQTEVMAPNFNEIFALIRYNKITELSNILPFNLLKNFNKSRLISLYNTPKNISVIPTPTLYLPLDIQYKSLGKIHYNSVVKSIQKCQLNFDIIHAHNTWSAGDVGAKLKEKYHVPFIVTAHGYDIYTLPFKDKIWENKIEHVLNSADHIITVSQSNLACIKRLDVFTPVTVIPNGFRSDLFYPRSSSECRKILDLPQDKKIILTVGNLEPVKGHKYLVEAVLKIIQERKDILCVIVGAGKLHTALERHIRSLGLENYIMLAGGKPHDEIPLWMNACDLFVLPSLRESFGVVQIEAMACGKPVVATRNGGSEEIITSNKYGSLVKNTNPEEIAKEIIIALDQKWNKETIKNYAGEFTWEDIAKDIVKIYEVLI